EPRPLRNSDGAEIPPRTLPFVERPLDDAADVSDVLTRCQLGDDAAPLAVNRHLRGNHVGPDGPRPRHVGRFLHDSGGGLVTGGFDPENSHQLDRPRNHERTKISIRFRGSCFRGYIAIRCSSNARFSDSLYGGRKIPRSVMMPE